MSAKSGEAHPLSRRRAVSDHSLPRISARRPDYAPIRQDNGERQDVFPHRAVADRRGSGGTRCRHPAEGSIGPGSTEKNRPVARRCSLSCSWVTPASTVASRSPALTCRIWFIREISIHTPPRNATTWPSKPVPLPKGIIGTLCRAHIWTISLTSAVDCANATAAGGTQG